MGDSLSSILMGAGREDRRWMVKAKVKLGVGET